jgi:hypothetical protein
LSLILVLVAGLAGELRVKPCWLATNRHNQIAGTEIINATKNNKTNASILLSPQVHTCNLTRS